MDELAQSLVEEIVAFVAAAQKASWPLPLLPADGEAAPTKNTARSALLDPADFGFQATARFDAAGISAYCLDLRAAANYDQAEDEEDQESILQDFNEAFELLCDHFDVPFMAVTGDERTGYRWWVLPGGLGLHLVFTDEVAVELWVTGCGPAGVGGAGLASDVEKVATAPAASTDPGDAASPEQASAGESSLVELAAELMGGQWSKDRESLLSFAASQGWVRLSGSDEYFFLSGGVPGAERAESHPGGEPLGGVICTPPQVLVTGNGLRPTRLTLTLPNQWVDDVSLAALSARLGSAEAGQGEGGQAGQSEAEQDGRAGPGEKHTWRVGPRVLELSCDGAQARLVVREEPAGWEDLLDRGQVLSYALDVVEELTAGSEPLDAADVERLAAKHGWTKTECDEDGKEVFLSPRAPWGLPGVVVDYHNAAVRQILFHCMPGSRALAGERGRWGLEDDLLEQLESRCGEYELVESSWFGYERPWRHLDEQDDVDSYVFWAANRRSRITVKHHSHQLPIVVDYPLVYQPPQQVALEFQAHPLGVKETRGKHVWLLALLIPLLALLVWRLW
ncbi:hypothetical protein [Buchananella felis]|uniref:hypothetical protein n=1 Tax=Buchananella felis TaxID=3231492 RepID=UPI0035283092